MDGIVTAWGRMLRGYRPALSVEITRECPLRCPGCYAYGGQHLGGDVTLRQLSDFKGDELIRMLMHLRGGYAKLRMPRSLIAALADPPHSPDECIFAQTTTRVSADFTHQIAPGQFGSTPDRANCECIASAALAAVGRHRLPGGIPVGAVFAQSLRIGRGLRRLRALRPQSAN